MKIWNYLLASALLSLGVMAKSQSSGYLGALNSVQLKTNLVPSCAYTADIKSDTRIKYRWKFFNPSFSLSYSRVLSKNIEVTAAYQYALVNFYAGHRFFGSEGLVSDYNFGFGQTYFAEHAKASYHGGFFAFDFYRFGSIAPVGKYLGFSVSFGRTAIDSNDYFVAINSSSNPIGGLFSTSIQVDAADTFKVESGEAYALSTACLKVRMGRNYPITDNLMISVGMSAPLLSSFRINDGLTDYGFRIEDRNFYFFDDFDESWEEYLKRSVKIYHRIQIELGLKFCF